MPKLTRTAVKRLRLARELAHRSLRYEAQSKARTDDWVTIRAKDFDALTAQLGQHVMFTI